jgi:hypothetical protein
VATARQHVDLGNPVLVDRRAAGEAGADAEGGDSLGRPAMRWVEDFQLWLAVGLARRPGSRMALTVAAAAVSSSL